MTRPNRTIQRDLLAAVHQTFRAWFGEGYDLDAIDAVLATAAAERLDGDPLWLMLITGSGNSKTETLGALVGSDGVVITSTISSEGALLSASPRKDRSKDATGGLLRRLGDRGVLVIKDFTSILSMDRNTRANVLAAVREVHDGFWERNVGTDGGRSLAWRGRIGLIAACTTAWDRAHDVVAAMGDRFVSIRMDSTEPNGRRIAGQKAMANTGDEPTMRAALAAAVGAALAKVDPRAAERPSPEEAQRLLAAADTVTLTRTGIDYDYRGAVIDAHAPEMPTRFAKQLVQVMRGACAVGLTRADAFRLALRCARDSTPPLRLAILRDVAAHPHTRPRDVRQRLNKPHSTVDRQLQALHFLDVLETEEVEIADPVGRPKDRRTVCYYSLNETRIDPECLRVPDLLPPTPSPQIVVPHKSGTGAAAAVPGPKSKPDREYERL
jgi:hypothetical protein